MKIKLINDSDNDSSIAPFDTFLDEYKQLLI